MFGCAGDPAIPDSIAPPSGLEALDVPVRAQYEERQAALRKVLDSNEASSEEKAAAFGALAQWYHVYSFSDGAIEAYNAARSLSPDDPRWHYLLAHAERKLGHGESAQKLFQRVLELEPDNVAARVWLAETAWQAGSLAQAEEAYDAALKQDPRCVRALAGRAKIAASRGQLESAAEHYQQALNLQPDATELRYALGLVYRKLGDRQRATAELARIPADNRHHVSPALDDPRMQQLNSLWQGTLLYQDLGRKAFQAGRFAEAIEHFRRALQSDPGNVQALLNLGLALDRSGEPAAAQAAVSEAVERDPSFVRGRLTLGTLLLRSHQLGPAQEQFQKAAELDPNDAQVRFNLAQLLRGRGQLAEALPHYARARALDPRMGTALHGHAVTLLWLGQAAAAVSALEQDVQQLPGAAELHFLLARLLAAAPSAALDGQRAVELTRNTMATTGTTLNAAETLAMALAEVGQFELAAAWQQAAKSAAAAVGENDILPRIEGRLQLYRQHRPCREPWTRGEASSPLPVTPPAVP